MATKNPVTSSYEVTSTPAIRDIFANLDKSVKAHPVVRESFASYTGRVEDFVDKNKQPWHEIKMRLTVYKLLRDTIEPYFNGGYLALGGSTLNQISTHGADLDLCFAIKCSYGTYDESLSPYVLTKIMYILDDEPFIRNTRYIAARVPILKINLGFPYHDIDVDINCNCVAGIFNSHLIYYCSKLDERFVQMNIIMKEWGKVRTNVIDPRHGKLNSYTMTLMVLHFLQCGVDPPILPNLYKLFPNYFDGTGDVEDLNYELDLAEQLPKIPKNTRTVGELIYGFLEYYSRFNFDDWWISIREASVFSRTEAQDKQFLFFLEEAYDGMTVPKNLTRRHKLREIVESFQEERQVILDDLFAQPDQLQKQPTPPIDTTYDFICESWPGQQQDNGI